VRFSLIPRNYPFYDLFEEIAAQLVRASECMADVLEHFENVEMKTSMLEQIEHESDNLTHDVYRGASRRCAGASP
jgi:uncharacterized protein Yka (UPF0111/DUF47 family)